MIKYKKNKLKSYFKNYKFQMRKSRMRERKQENRKEKAGNAKLEV